MTRQEILALHKQMAQKSRAIMAVKNEDYADVNDPMKNFKSAAFLNVEPGIGILLRVLDKIARLHTFWLTGKLKAESVDDAELDIINYMVLHRGLRSEQDERAGDQGQGSVCGDSQDEDHAGGQDVSGDQL